MSNSGRTDLMNLLTDVLPPQVRKDAYALLALAALALGAYKGSGGDWLEIAVRLTDDTGGRVVGIVWLSYS